MIRPKSFLVRLKLPDMKIDDERLPVGHCRPQRFVSRMTQTSVPQRSGELPPGVSAERERPGIAVLVWRTSWQIYSCDSPVHDRGVCSAP